MITIRKKEIEAYAFILAIVFIAFLSNSFNYIVSYRNIKYVLIIFIALGLFKKLPQYREDFFKYFWPILLLDIVIIISSLINRSNVSTDIVSNLFDAIYILELFVGGMLTIKKVRWRQIVKCIFGAIFFIVVINDAIVLLGISKTDAWGYPVYFVGTKFDVVYLHFSLIVSYLLMKNVTVKFHAKSLLLYILFTLYVVMISILVDCSTGVVGSLALLFFLLVFDSSNIWYKKAFNSKYFFGLSLLVSFLFIFAYVKILDIRFVQSFVTNVLHRSTTLTGRTNIYGKFLQSMRENILWGYGYGNSYSTSKALFGYGDTQNCICEWVIQIGFVGVIALVVLLLYYFSKLKVANDRNCLIPIVSLIYTYNILGMIEITITFQYLFWIMLIFIYSLKSIQSEIAR